MVLIALLGCRSAQAPEEVPAKEKAPREAVSEKKPEKQAQLKLPGEEFYSDHTDEVSWAERCPYETEHYLIDSNCNDKILRRYEEMLEAFYDKWCELVCKPALNRRFHVRIYANHKEFMDNKENGKQN